MKYLHPVSVWQKMINQKSGKLQKEFIKLYGAKDLIEKPLELLKRAIDEFARSFGANRSVFVVRSTGRINLLGMHIDHRGGSVNPIAIKEAFFIVEPRDDDVVILRDINSEEFPEESFSISKCLPKGEKIANWDKWCHDELEKRRGEPGITFSNYVRAGVLYFQHLHTTPDGKFDPPFKGMNVMIASNVPPAAGLSTSSCLVVASAEAIMHRNNITMDPMQFCEHCGFAEWYVGTRGGFGDHAAIKMGKVNSIVHMTAFPFSLKVVPFPAGYRVVLADSLVEAKKQAGAKDGYNTPLTSYAVGLLLARKNFPQYADKMKYLRDINPATLGVNDAEIFRIIKSLPISATREEILNMLPEHKETIENLFRSHNPPKDGYKIRQVCMYGISECMRSELAVNLLEKGDIETFGHLISLHHDGDRVSRLINGKMIPEIKDYSDKRMDQLIADASSNNKEKVEKARVWQQPGGYNVSVPEIDMLADLAKEVDGVMGAGIVGAGLGGSLIALVKEESAHKLVNHFAERYYKAKSLPVRAEIVSAVEGAGVLKI